MSRFSRGALMCLLGFLLAAGGVGSVRRFAGEHYLVLSNRLVVRKQRAEAIAVLEQALAWNPGRSEIARRLGDLHTESYDDLPEATVAKLTERGRSLLGQAISAYLHAIDSEPGDARAWAGLGGAYARIAAGERSSHGIELGRFSTSAPEHLLPAERLALAAFDRALALEPNNYTYRDERAGLLLELGLRKEAFAEYRRSAEIMPIYPLHNWGPIEEIDPGLVATITEGFLTALRTNPMVPRYEVLRQLGEFVGARGSYDTAERYFEEAEAVAPDRRIALIMRFMIGEEQKAQGKVEEAFASYGKATAEAWPGRCSVRGAAPRCRASARRSLPAPGVCSRGRSDGP